MDVPLYETIQKKKIHFFYYGTLSFLDVENHRKYDVSKRVEGILLLRKIQKML